MPDLRHLIVATLVVFLPGCSGDGGSSTNTAESCMTCHNGATANDYSGPGLENPHPFPGAGNLRCTTCHGGNPNGENKDDSHVPPPPEIGDRDFQATNRRAYFNRLTLAGIDKFPDYTVGGRSYTALDYLQFINPGDLRIVSNGRSCGQCHSNHADTVNGSVLATATGIFSGAMFAAGDENKVPESQGLYEDTAADLAFRAVQDADFGATPPSTGAVGRLLEVPVVSVFGETGGTNLFNNDSYSAASLVNDLEADNRVRPNSNLSRLYNEQVAFTCGDCHLGSAGANNRYGDFRSSGCTSCHMQYSLDGRSRSGDPNVNTLEPADPDDIDEPEQPHIRRHLIQSVAKTLPSGEHVQGINDYACAGCHQGSNRTVMQYWGIRLDQNQDVRRGNQYPANPASYQTTSGDERLFDPVVGNNTFNGRNRNQYLRFEDYDGDGRDDTPADVHYEAGMGCIDCHGSYDLHGGPTDGSGAELVSRMEQSVAIQCEDCHGSATAYAATTSGTTYGGDAAEIGVDSKGNPLRHVVKEGDDYFLYSRLTGARHYIKQTRDTIVDTGVVNPLDNEPVYSERASYAMGRADGDPATGIGPQQVSGAPHGFTHMTSMSCASCHAAWTNSCIGCHLGGEYNTGNNNFSNITGERIVFREAAAEFVYQTPVHFQLGVDTHNKIAPISPNTETFFHYEDRHHQFSDTFSFSDRNSAGNNATAPAMPSLSHNVLMPHSIRGRVTAENEGARNCVSCHLTDGSMAAFGPEYAAFRTAMATNDWGNLDFELLQTHIGENTGNQLNSPFWVHMVAGLGSGLFLFDENGCPVNPLDENDDRFGCTPWDEDPDNDNAPADNFDPGRVYFNLDRIVNPDGTSNSSNNHPMLVPGLTPNRRTGAQNPNLSGPLGATTIQKLVDPGLGIVLDSWIDADGNVQGNASNYVSD